VSVPAIRLDALTKYYGPVVGVEKLSLQVEQGEVFGFLGANGAGKTTTIRMLLDLLRPSSGSAAVLGFDTRHQSLEVRRRIGYLPGEMPVYPELTGAGYLGFLSTIGPVPASNARLQWLFRRFDVSDLDLRRRMRDYSHGMKRKLGIIQALMTDAPVLALDEPTSGLDPLMIEAFAETIDEIARAGRTTVFLSSHILSEVDRMCQRIALIRGGTLVAVRTLTELRAGAPRRVTVTFSDPVCAADRNAFTAFLGRPSVACTVVSRDPQRWVLDVQGPLGPLVASLTDLPVSDVTVAPFSLEETILRLMEDSSRDALPQTEART
jgi:ABC-2 type transport system ATP-binding protein